MSLNYRIKRLDQYNSKWRGGPKVEYQIEYNLILREWCEIIKQMSEKKKFKDKKSTFSHYTVGNLKSIKFK